MTEFKSTLPPRKRAKTQAEKEQRKMERILRNRRAAHALREKKRKYVEYLENYINVLSKNVNNYKANQEMMADAIKSNGVAFDFGKLRDINNSLPEFKFDNKKFTKNIDGQLDNDHDLEHEIEQDNEQYQEGQDSEDLEQESEDIEHDMTDLSQSYTQESELAQTQNFQTHNEHANYIPKDKESIDFDPGYFGTQNFNSGNNNFNELFQNTIVNYLSPVSINSPNSPINLSLYENPIEYNSEAVVKSW